MIARDAPTLSFLPLPEPDILDRVAIEVPCFSCGRTYSVTARQILLAEDVLGCGCQGTDDRECLPLAYADLIDTDSLRELAAAWRTLQQHAARRGCSVHL